MFQAATSILTLIALVGHVLLGCCAHHAHHAPAAVDADHQRAAVAAHRVCSHRHAAHYHRHATSPSAAGPVDHPEPDGSESHEHGSDPCDIHACSYLVADVAKCPDGMLPSATVELLSAANASLVSRGDLRDRVDADACAAGYRDGARRHALMAVWLL
jgi:hypothetical protein